MHLFPGLTSMNAEENCWVTNFEAIFTALVPTSGIWWFWFALSKKRKTGEEFKGCDSWTLSIHWQITYIEDVLAIVGINLLPRHTLSQYITIIEILLMIINQILNTRLLAPSQTWKYGGGELSGLALLTWQLVPV